MATIVPTLMTGSGQRTLAPTIMKASNTFVYKPGTGQILMLRNGTAARLRQYWMAQVAPQCPSQVSATSALQPVSTQALWPPPQPLQSRSTRLARSCRALST